MKQSFYSKIEIKANLAQANLFLELCESQLEIQNEYYGGKINHGVLSPGYVDFHGGWLFIEGAFQVDPTLEHKLDFYHQQFQLNIQLRTIEHGEYSEYNYPSQQEVRRTA